MEVELFERFEKSPRAWRAGKDFFRTEGKQAGGTDMGAEIGATG